MRKSQRFLLMAVILVLSVTLTVLSLPAGQAAQGVAARNAAAPATPRLPDGTVNLGRVDGEKGVWNTPFVTNAGGSWNRNMGDAAIVVGATPPRGAAAAVTPGGGRGGAPSEPWVPFQPWAAAVYNYNSLNSSKYDPQGYCLPPGGPRQFATPYPMEFIHLPQQKRILIVFEGGGHIWREIHMDGRPHPTRDKIQGQTWMGHSVGRWEGDTLVVDVVGFNEGTWLDYYGHPHTDMLHVIERFSRPNKNVLHYEATIDDPGAYTRPWTISWNLTWDEDGELEEYICQENNAYMGHLKDDFGNHVVDID